MDGVRVTRREALAALVVAGVLVAAGLVWLFGPYGLIGSGFALAALVLFGVDVEERRGEAVEVAARPRRAAT